MVYGVNEVGEGAIVLVGIDVGVCVGRSVLVEVVVAVNVGVDVMKSVESQLVMRHYDGFIKRGRLKGRR